MIEYGRRTRKLPAPPGVVWDDLVERRQTGPRAWFDLVRDEVVPKVLESERPSRVVWSSLWPSRPRDRIVLELVEDLGSTMLTFSLLAPDGDAPDESTTGHIRKRVNHLLWADLRFSYGQ